MGKKYALRSAKREDRRDRSIESGNMKPMISEKQLEKAFRKGELGADRIYEWWTLLWGVRSRIWSERELKENVRVSLGEMVEDAFYSGKTKELTNFAAALEEMKKFEQKPENAARADIFFGVVELNESGKTFTRAKLRKWINKELETGVSAEELGNELGRMDLARLIPR